MDDRKYTDREFALILKRAATLQAQGDEPRHGLAELQDVAAQVGIPAELVARAAADLHAQTSHDARLGPSPSIHVTALVPGTLRPAIYPDLLAAIRRVTRDPGEVRELSSGLQWTRNTGYSTLTVAVSSAPEGVVLRIEGEHEGNRTMVYLIPVLVAGVAGVVTGGTAGWELGLAVGTGGIGAALVAARAMWRGWARQAQATVDRLKESLLRELQK